MTCSRAKLNILNSRRYYRYYWRCLPSAERKTFHDPNDSGAILEINDCRVCKSSCQMMLQYLGLWVTRQKGALCNEKLRNKMINIKFDSVEILQLCFLLARSLLTCVIIEYTMAYLRYQRHSNTSKHFWCNLHLSFRYTAVLHLEYVILHW